MAVITAKLYNPFFSLSIQRASKIEASPAPQNQTPTHKLYLSTETSGDASGMPARKTIEGPSTHRATPSICAIVSNL
jgi:hypothetical protein